MHAHVDVVKLLLESGAQPSLYHKCPSYSTPIGCAVVGIRIDMVKLLLKYHEKEDDKELLLETLADAFVWAAQVQSLEIVNLFLDVCGPEIIHSRDNCCGWTPLHECCDASDDTEVMKFLLNLGANVKAVDNNGGTPIFNAVNYRRPECVEVLLAAGANVNHVNNHGETPLDRALDRSLYEGPEPEEVRANIEASAKIVRLLEAAGGLEAEHVVVSNDEDEDDDEDDEEEDDDDEDAWLAKEINNYMMVNNIINS